MKFGKLGRNGPADVVDPRAAPGKWSGKRSILTDQPAYKSETGSNGVKSIKEFGAFVEFLPGKQGLLHISEIMWKRLNSMEGVLNEGDKVKVKIIGVDPKTGKFKLSRKALLPKPEQPARSPQNENEQRS